MEERKQHADEDGGQGATTQGKSKLMGQRNAAANEDAILEQWQPSLKIDPKVTYKEQIQKEKKSIIIVVNNQQIGVKQKTNSNEYI